MSSLSEANEKLLEIYKAELAPPTSWELKNAIAYRRALSGLPKKNPKGIIARFAPIGGIGMSNTSIPQSFPFIRFTNENPDPDDEELLRRGELIRNAMNKYDPYSTDHFEPLIFIRGEPESPDSIRYNANLVDAPSVPDPVIEYIKTLPKSPGPKMEILSSAKKFQASDYDADKLFFWTDGAINDAKATPANGNMLNIHLAIKRHGGDFLLKLKEEHVNRMIDIQIEIDRQLREFMIFGTTGNYVNRYTFMEALSTFPNEADNMMYNYVIDDATYKIFAKTLEIDSKGYRKWKRYVADKMARYLRFMTVHYKGKAETSGASNDMEKYTDLNAKAADNRDRIDAITRVRIARVAPAAAAAPATPPAPLSLEDMRKNIIANISNTDIASKANPLCGANKNVTNYTKRMERWGFDVSVIQDKQKLAELLASFVVNDLIRLYETPAFCAFDQRNIIVKLDEKFPVTANTDEKRATFTSNIAKGIALTPSAPPATPPATGPTSAPPATVKPLKDRVMENNRVIPKGSRANGKGRNVYLQRMKQLGFEKSPIINDFKGFTKAELVELFDKDGMLRVDDQIFLLLDITGIDKKTLMAYLKSKGGNNQNNRIQMVLDLVSPPRGVLIGDYIVYIEKRGEFYSKFSKNNCVRYLRPNFPYDNRIGVISNINWDDGDADIKLYEEVKDKGAPPEFRVKLVFLEPLKPEDCNSEQFNSNIALKAAQKQQLKQQIFDNQDFGILEGQDALDFIKQKKLTLSTSTPGIEKQWFNDSSVVNDLHYSAKLYYDAENGDVNRLVIACIEASDDIDEVGAGDETTMELIEIQNYAKKAVRSTVSIRPFVQKVLKEEDYNGVKTVYLSPANKSLTKMYTDLWGMEEAELSKDAKNRGVTSTWLKAEKSKLIKTLGKPKQVMEAEKKAREAASKAQQEIINAKELAATTESGDNWYVLKDGNDTMFYISSQDGNENLMSIIGSLPTDDHILKHETLTLKKVGDFHLFKMDNLTYKVKLDDDLTDIILTRNVGKALLIDETVQTGPLISEIRKQALDGLKALHKVGIVHQDIKLDNMAWDDKTNRLTIIDFGNARKVGNACESTFNGDDYNILPPVGVSENQYFSDKWSLVLALLQYGKKTMYASGDDPNDTIKSELTKLLFSADTEMKQDQNGCFKLLPEPEQSGLMFHNDDDETFKYRKELMKDVKVTTFHHLWFIFNRQADFNPPNLDEKGLVPGYRDKSELIDGVDYVKELAIRMGKTNVDLANKWIEGHLRWENLQAQVVGQPLKLITGAKIKDSKTQKPQFRTETLRDDLGIKYYGIPTKEVVEIFKIIGNYEAANKIKPTSSTSLNYDSFSDAELDELEVTYEPYDEEELDRLMSEYDSSSGTDANMSYNSYNSESEQSVESDSYDSDSD